MVTFKGDAAAGRIAHLKKAEMAAEAERLLADSGWLPEALRTSGIAVVTAAGEPDASVPDAAQ